MIYGSHNKLFISTGKRQYFAASNYVDFVLKSLIEMPKFSYLKMDIVHVYKQLLFYDIHNYAGIQVDVDALPKSFEILEEDIESHIFYYQNWKLKGIFPAPV